MSSHSTLVKEPRPRVRETVAPKRNGMTVNDVYEQLRQIATLYTIRPGERVNELELAEQFEVSRTPLREALNRLVAEGLLTFVPNRGFFVRKLDRQDIFDLYELRCAVEVLAIVRVCERASDADLKELRKFWKGVMKSKPNLDASEFVKRDEEFHLRLVALSGNNEIVRALYNINARIHFVRWIDVEQRGQSTHTEHMQLLDLLDARDSDGARRLLESHISRRMEEITNVVQASVVRLYTGEDSVLPSHGAKP
ncbi:GntR family transcriptional regulator [Paraburkholderia caribensis]|uniref:GntR family transcriptional regulator n=1 Tax=Paraburkholderia caribensis TaxID=75105 RepID=UPI001CAC5791|nr:GntR family transcriptional regulator [Paraburkholderia caribensis]CAG9242135.1 Nta operon transcriptional regulator [Paraburkholderia caribensis]